ncbi:MAG TPA: sialidase family protein [Polyangia bacterium]|nr:sialidase family protein [Polyangia bacterium]
MKALPPASAARPARPPHRPLVALLVHAAGALALVAGCGGASGVRDGGELRGDGSPKADLGAEMAGKNDAAADGRADAGAADRGPTAADTRDAIPESRPDAPPGQVQPTFCPAVIPTLTVDSGTVTGVLEGASNNPAVSCRGGVPTPGPESFFTLTVTQQATVILTVAAPVDTVVAIRPGPCSDTISELACGEQPPAVGADAGVPAIDAGAGARLSGVSAPLAPGTYTVIVDTYTLGSLTSANFSLTIGHIAPAANAACASPTLLTLGMTAPAQPLDLAGAPKPVCGGTALTSLYYTVGVPAGQRLSAKAVPRAGDQTWMPRLSAFTSCASNTCIAQGHVVSGTTQQLDWVNNGASWQLIYLSVGADGPVSGATFDLSVSAVDLFATCDRPTSLVDGTVVPNQDLSIAPTPTGQTCTGATHAFYYSAVLLPQQTITLQTTPSADATNFFQPQLGIRTSCDSATCISDDQGSTSFVNRTDQDLPILVEATTSETQFISEFDLTVSMPPPPAGVLVTPTTGLVTTESGGTATFTVALQSPPADDVTIAVASDTPTEGTASPASLTFTPATWRTPQTVTVTGVDDSVADGPRDYTIVTSPATSDDGRYSGLDPDDVSVTNLDNEPGVSFVGAGSVVTSESGTTATFGVALTAAPTADVTMTLASSDVGEGTVAPAQLTFTAANWSVAQTVTVTGVDDAVVDGTQLYSIVTGALTSTDARYGGQNPADVTARNLDDDQAPVPLKVVSGDHSCSSPAPFPIAVDAANQLYLVMACEVGLSIATSTDAGVTFTDPVQIPGTDDFSGPAKILGGAPGFAYLLFGGSDGSVFFTRTADGGVTWSSRVTLSDRQDTMNFGAADKTVVVVTAGADGANQNVFWRSLDGGKSFLPKAFVDGANSLIEVEPDGRTVRSVELVSNIGELQKSSDAAATFTKVGDISQDISQTVNGAVLIGHANLFGFAGNTLQIGSLADLTQVTSSIDFLNVPPFAMAVDDLDRLAILDTDPNGHLRATRVAPGQTPPAGGRSLGPSPSTAGIATLSRKAAAVAVQNGNLILFTTVVW